MNPVRLPVFFFCIVFPDDPEIVPIASNQFSLLSTDAFPTLSRILLFCQVRKLYCVNYFLLCRSQPLCVCPPICDSLALKVEHVHMWAWSPARNVNFCPPAVPCAEIFHWHFAYATALISQSDLHFRLTTLPKYLIQDILKGQNEIKN